MAKRPASLMSGYELRSWPTHTSTSSGSIDTELMPFAAMPCTLPSDSMDVTTDTPVG